MLTLVLRYGVLFAGLVLIWLATVSARLGDPPPFSLFSPRATLVVENASVVTVPVGNGTRRTLPEIKVEWPRDSDVVTQVKGLQALTQRGDVAHARELVAANPTGSEIRVRIVNGQPMANRQDLFGTIHALGMGVMGLLIAGVGVLLNRALK